LNEGAPEDRVRWLYRRLFVREPDARELALGVAFIRRQEQAGPSLPPPVWGYGQGRIDSAAGRVADFHAFPHWTGSAWQFGPTLPSPDGSYANWHSGGGHTGVDPDHAVVLRWTAPRDGSFTVEGELGHAEKKGDGVRGRVVSSRVGVLGDWVAHGAKTPTKVDRFDLKAGDTLDFVVDCRAEPSFDSFTWAPTVRESTGATETWNAASGFHGPSAGGLTPWEEYAQVLMLTNEFVFVD
jgi:hypothetical protein